MGAYILFSLIFKSYNCFKREVREDFFKIDWEYFSFAKAFYSAKNGVAVILTKEESVITINKSIKIKDNICHSVGIWT
jgi:hypothetical protein